MRKRNWKKTFQAWCRPQVTIMFFLGFSAGIPFLLIFSTLSIWLTEAGVDRSSVTFFSWAALGYSFKFIWAPIIDKMPLPFLTAKLGRRRSWLILSQCSVIVSLFWMAYTNPSATSHNLTFMAMAAVLLGFSSASQDIVIDAYRIECVEEELQALISSTYIAGYRIGMLISGAGALYLASILGTSKEYYNYPAWKTTYCAMALVMLIGVITTLVISEPDANKKRATYNYSAIQYFRFLCLFIFTATIFSLTFFYSHRFFIELKHLSVNYFIISENLAGFIAESLRFVISLSLAFTAAYLIVILGISDRNMLQDTYIAPIKNFFDRYSLKTALLLLILIGFYRISDIVLSTISNVFFVDLGFSKEVISTISKTFGMLATILGGVLGGILTVRFGVLSILLLGAVLSCATNLLFLFLTHMGAHVPTLTLVIAADNLSAGLASTAFVAFLSSLTHISFTAVQYAIFSSLMTLFPKLIGGYSGTIVSSWGYDNFFIMTTLMGIPVLVIVWKAKKLLVNKKMSGE